MKLKDYVEALTKLLKENPETGEYLVVTSKDDEGNGFNLVHYPASVGHYDEEEREFKEVQVANAVCVN